MKYLFLFISALLLTACVSETQVKSPTEAKPKGNMTPEIQEVQVKSIFPVREDWKLLFEYDIPGVDPTGIAFVKPDLIVVSDTAQNKIYSVLIDNKGAGEVSVLRSGIKSAYINHRIGKLILPEYEKDSIFVYRGEETYYKFNLPEALKNPSSFDGFTIHNYTIVDQGNNRLFMKKGADYSETGSFGSGEGQFDNPTVVHKANGRQYVVDSGNRRIQILKEDGSYISEFGKEQDLVQPTGLTSNGTSNIFVCDAIKGYVYMYDAGGNFIYKFNPGITSPSDVYFFREKLYVADKKGATIKVLTNKFYNDLIQS